MWSVISNKRQAFRNQLRHKELQSYFANKRKLLSNQIMEVQHHTFKNAYQYLLEQKDIDQNLIILSGLAFDKQLWQQFQDINKAQQLYFQLILLLVKLVQRYKDRQNDSKKRIICLNIISNLLADQQCPNSQIAQIICNFLKQFYQSVNCWGFDKEMVEVGCLIANLINKQSFMEGINEDQTQYILQWIQELLHIKQQHQMAVSLYFGLATAARSLQKKYNLQEYQLPELYRTRFMNFIEVTLYNKSLNSSPSSALYQRAYKFINLMIPTILTVCPYQWCEKLVKNIFANLASLKKMQFYNLSAMLIKIITLGGIFISEAHTDKVIETRNKIRDFIVQNYQNKIIIYLTVLQFQIKEKIFQIIVRLIQCDQFHASFYLETFVSLGLQNWMIKNFEVNNSQLQILFFQMVNLANELRMGDCFKAFIEHTQTKKGETFQRRS